MLSSNYYTDPEHDWQATIGSYIQDIYPVVYLRTAVSTLDSRVVMIGTITDSRIGSAVWTVTYTPMFGSSRTAHIQDTDAT